MTKSRIFNTIAGHPSRVIRLFDSEIPCYVLETGVRVLDRRGFLERMGVSESGADHDFLSCVSAPNLAMFVTAEMRHMAQPLRFRTPDGIEGEGIHAELLPDVLYVFVQAKRGGLLEPDQTFIADMAEILFRGLCLVGIVPLVDEVTGYQNDRPAGSLNDRFNRLLKA